MVSLFYCITAHKVQYAESSKIISLRQSALHREWHEQRLAAIALNTLICTLNIIISLFLNLPSVVVSMPLRSACTRKLAIILPSFLRNARMVFRPLWQQRTYSIVALNTAITSKMPSATQEIRHQEVINYLWQYHLNFFLLRLSLIKPSQVMFMAKFSPTDLNLDYDFVVLVHFWRHILYIYQLVCFNSERYMPRCAVQILKCRLRPKSQKFELNGDFYLSQASSSIPSFH